jgi:hypothetical protein
MTYLLSVGLRLAWTRSMITNKFRSLIKIIPAGPVPVLLRLAWTGWMISNQFRAPIKFIHPGLISVGASVGTAVHLCWSKNGSATSG